MDGFTNKNTHQGVSHWYYLKLHNIHHHHTTNEPHYNKRKQRIMGTSKSRSHSKGKAKLSTSWLLSILGALIITYFSAGGGSSYTYTLDNAIIADSLPAATLTINKEKETTRTHHCLNEDFQPQHRVSIWTMLNDNPQYVQGAIKLGRAIERHTTTPHDRVVMELEHKPLSEESWSGLRQSGFIRCVVSPIPPPNLEKTRRDLREKFAVLHIWAMSVYDRVVFVDADTYPRASLDHLFTMDLQGKPVGVTKDIRDRKWVQTFNSGVLLLHPTVEEHNRLVALLRSGMEFDYVMSDQGFLNEVYKDNWHEIGFVNNANLALYRFQRDFWDQHKLEDINIIHYTMSKPWNCGSKGPYGPICDVWINAE